MNITKSICLSFLLAGSSVLAGPITTVPWNGHVGAASFTYDDARNSQLPTVIPQLDALGIKGTFFITQIQGYSFPSKQNEWIEAVKKGHELGNHTSNHNTPNSSNVKTMASTLRNLHSSVEAVTFAYPSCTATGQNYVNEESFIGRSCGGVNYSWNASNLNWMAMDGLIVKGSNGNNVSTAIDKLNSAKNGSWIAIIVHDVTNPIPDEWSITPAENQSLLNQAVSNQLWIDTYQNVAAYYRAHFVMDQVNAQKTSTGWKATWSSPHSKMPKSVPLRIKLDPTVFGNTFTVLQKGNPIVAEKDGSYIIDFMTLSLDISNTPLSSSSTPSSSSETLSSSSSSSSDVPSQSSSSQTTALLPNPRDNYNHSSNRLYDLLGKLQTR